MGYYSSFSIKVTANGESLNDIVMKIAEVSGYTWELSSLYNKEGFTLCTDDDESYIANQLKNMGSIILEGADEYKWYDYEEHLRLVAKLFPKATFVCYRRGEDWDDIEGIYLCNDKYRSAFARFISPFEVMKQVKNLSEAELSTLTLAEEDLT